MRRNSVQIGSASEVPISIPKTSWRPSLFTDDGRICITNNAVERALRGAALGRKTWLFAGSPRGGDRAGFMYSLIVTAKMNDIDAQAWLADVLARMPGIVVSHLAELLPWNWKANQTAKVARPRPRPEAYI